MYGLENLLREEAIVGCPFLITFLLMTLIDPLILLYYAWVPNDVCQTYEGDIKTIIDRYELNEKA